VSGWLHGDVKMAAPRISARKTAYPIPWKAARKSPSQSQSHSIILLHKPKILWLDSESLES